MTLQRIATIVLYILFIISLGITAWFFFGGNVQPEHPVYPEPIATSTFIVWSYILFGIAAILTLLFSFIHIFSSGSSIKSTVIVLVIAGILVAVSYSLSSGDPITFSTTEASASTLKLVDTGLYVTYILLAVAFIGIIFSGIFKATR